MLFSILICLIVSLFANYMANETTFEDFWTLVSILAALTTIGLSVLAVSALVFALI